MRYGSNRDSNPRSQRWQAPSFPQRHSDITFNLVVGRQRRRRKCWGWTCLVVSPLQLLRHHCANLCVCYVIGADHVVVNLISQSGWGEKKICWKIGDNLEARISREGKPICYKIYGTLYCKKEYLTVMGNTLSPIFVFVDIMKWPGP
jgi:hypothetical protein